MLVLWQNRYSVKQITVQYFYENLPPPQIKTYPQTSIVPKSDAYYSIKEDRVPTLSFLLRLQHLLIQLS